MGGEETIINKKIVDPLRLSSCHLIEILPDNSLLWSWSYPHLSSQLRTICSSKCKIIFCQRNKKMTSFSEEQEEESSSQENGIIQGKGRSFFHLDKLWYYVVFPPVVPSDHNTSQVKMIGVVVVAEDFYPELYERVGNALYLTYIKTKDCSIVLQQFLSLMVEGVCLLPKKKKFTLSDYNSSVPYDKHQIKEIILRFGLETILIYTALQRKTRIVIYHYDIDVLSDFILSLPFLCGDFSNEIWNSIYPWIDLNDDEVNFIKDIPFYVIGCTESGVESSSHLFDVFVNIPAGEISVAPHARESVAMNKTHKEMATFMVQLAGDENTSEEELVAAIIKRNAEIKNKL